MRWSVMQGSNLRPSGPKPDALPGCANHRTGLIVLSLVSSVNKEIDFFSTTHLPMSDSWSEDNIFHQALTRTSMY